MIYKVTDYYYCDDSTDYMFMLILNDFYSNEFYRSWLKSWVFDGLQQFLVARSCEKSKQTATAALHPSPPVRLASYVQYNIRKLILAAYACSFITLLNFSAAGALAHANQ
jgi:hypothetical protein